LSLVNSIGFFSASGEKGICLNDLNDKELLSEVKHGIIAQNNPKNGTLPGTDSMHFILMLMHVDILQPTSSSICNCISSFKEPAWQGLTTKFTHAQYHEHHHGCGSQDSIVSSQYDPQQGINKE